MEKYYDYEKIEREMQEYWEKDEVYKFREDSSRELYSIDTPPPTVSGSLHIGHIFSYTQAEMIARFRNMQGFNVLYPFGFDDNGLPTERLAETELGINARDIKRSEFKEFCAQTAAKYETEFKKLWKSMGFSVDWSLEYKTNSYEVMKLSQEYFLKLVEMGKAYIKESPVLWCTECRTSVAQAELDTKDVDTQFIYIPFFTEGEPLTVATTRPELLYGCVCLFVNPSDERYGGFIGKSARVPLYDMEIPIYSDDRVEPDKGTGVVMCATFGDSTDAEWYMQYKLPYRRVLVQDGSMSQDVPFVGGLTVKAARKKIIELLYEKELLIMSESVRHTVATHERCGREIEIIPSRQWYIEIMSEKERFLEAADEINWYPKHMKYRYKAWVENLKWDWCISRQRYFGIPFPVWYCESCGEAVFAEPEQLPVNPMETGYKGICRCGHSEFKAESAVLDTWATSSITPQINQLRALNSVPMSMRTHAHEIIRTWTFYTIVRSLYHTGKLPWKDLMINGFVLAKKGEKISKSKSNAVIEPAKLIKQHSADALRYWAASAKLGTDTFFSTDELAISKRFITKLWNASRFAISLLKDFDNSEKPQLLPIDRWILERTNDTIMKASRLLYEYEVGSARLVIDELFWKELCDNYIELIKERLYQPDIHGAQERSSGQYALYHTLLNILKLYAIYVPHITEYLYRVFFINYEKTPSIHLCLWEKPVTVDADILEFGERVKEVIFDARKLKSEKKLSMKAPIDCIEIRTEQKFMEWFYKTEKDIKACSNALTVKYLIL